MYRLQKQYVYDLRVVLAMTHNYGNGIVTDQDDRKISKAKYPKPFYPPEICSMTIEKQPLYYRPIITLFIDFTMVSPVPVFVRYQTITMKFKR